MLAVAFDTLNLATKDDIQRLESKIDVGLAQTKAEILKWLFAAIGTQNSAGGRRFHQPRQG